LKKESFICTPPLAKKIAEENRNKERKRKEIVKKKKSDQK